MAYLLDSDWDIDQLLEMPEATRLLEELSAEGLAISIILIIAATALEYNLILVTRNTADYHDVPTLKLYQVG
jgi:predicted nucleic acid-binding protein